MLTKRLHMLTKPPVPVVCIELPFISSNLGACEVPSISEQVASVEALGTRWGFYKLNLSLCHLNLSVC